MRCMLTINRWLSWYNYIYISLIISVDEALKSMLSKSQLSALNDPVKHLVSIASIKM